MEIIDNFIEPSIFKKFQYEVMTNLKWSFVNKVASLNDNGLDQFYFVHLLFEDFQVRSPFFDYVSKAIFPKLEVYSIFRMKINLYPRSNSLIKYGTHVDSNKPHKGAIFYVNTCDGYTGIDSEKIHSVSNRILKFDSSKPHFGTNCTDNHARFTLNINYF